MTEAARIRMVNATPFEAFAFAASVRPPRRSMTVVVKATFTLPDCNVADEQHLPSGDLRIGEDDDVDAPIRYASDFSPFKLRADITLSGHGYPTEVGEKPHRFGGTAGLAEVSIGDVTARVALFGPRTWDRVGAQTAPAPFERVPLDHRFAFGGPTVADNPVGCGRHATRMAQLEDPDDLIRSSSDRPGRVACFAPRPPTWKPRSKYLGCYRGSWARDRWPFFPDDFDWRYFNAAPSELQTAYLKGDETFRIAGVRPGGAVFQGALPGRVPCAFVRRGTAFVGVPMNLDTVHFDADRADVVLIWRGIVEADGDADDFDVDAIFVTQRNIDDDEASADALGRAYDAQLATEGDDVVDEPEEDDDEPPPIAPPPPDRQRVLAMLSAGDDLRDADLTGVDLSGEDLSGVDLTGATLAGANLKRTKLTGANLSGIYAEQLHAAEADFSNAVLTAADLSRGSLAGATFSSADLTDATLAGASLAGASFVGADAGAATFTEVRAAGADFTRATLDGADFSDAFIEGAVMSEARIGDAMFYGCRAAGACFDGAVGDDPRFDDAALEAARFFKARCDGASFESANLANATLAGSRLVGANFNSATLKQALLQGCDLTKASMARADLENAELFGSNLMRADLQDANLTSADLRQCNLYEAETWGARTDGLRIDDAMVAGSKLER